jgi:hypothetical protein
VGSIRDIAHWPGHDGVDASVLTRTRADQFESRHDRRNPETESDLDDFLLPGQQKVV